MSLVALARNPYLALLQTCDCEGSDRLTGAQLWWMAVRPCVFPMSIMSVLIGVLLAGKIGSWICGIPHYHHTTGSPSTRFIPIPLSRPAPPEGQDV